jgi:hypothetical protein
MHERLSVYERSNVNDGGSLQWAVDDNLRVSAVTNCSQMATIAAHRRGNRRPGYVFFFFSLNTMFNKQRIGRPIECACAEQLSIVAYARGLDDWIDRHPERVNRQRPHIANQPRRIDSLPVNETVVFEIATSVGNIQRQFEHICHRHA